MMAVRPVTMWLPLTMILATGAWAQDGLVAHAQAVHYPGPEALDDDISRLGQLVKKALPGLGLEVERHVFLIANGPRVKGGQYK